MLKQERNSTHDDIYLKNNKINEPGNVGRAILEPLNPRGEDGISDYRSYGNDYSTLLNDILV